MTRITADHGTVIPDGTSALIVDQTGKLNFYLARGSNDGELPTMVQLLAAVLIRSKDPNWVAEMISKFDIPDQT
ncbi:hypothetical protein [Tateyamaria sp.]|uniref:hypothetical protein n=1 Tax=Tateyamaria sp. TaxID=1929288 RepID=UPI00329CF8AF